jgi:hypothetical protein
MKQDVSSTLWVFRVRTHLIETMTATTSASDATTRRRTALVCIEACKMRHVAQPIKQMGAPISVAYT